MTNKVVFKFSPAFLKKLDSLFGRAAAHLLPRPQKQTSPASISSILIIRPGGIGDAALTAPLISALIARFPSAAVYILAEKRNAGVFGLIPGIRKVFLYDKPADLFSALRGWYDLVIDTEQWHRLSAVITRLTGTGLSIGFATNERSRLFTHTVPYSHDLYEAQSFLNLLTPLGMQISFDPAAHFLEPPVDSCQEVDASADWQAASDYVTIFPGASISQRRWGAGNFRQLAVLLKKEGFLPVVIGGDSEKETGNEIVAAGGLNYAGRTTIAGSAYLISKSRLLVSSDSGILHIGVGLGIPTVSLFGSGIAKKWGPGGKNNVMVDKMLACSPCTRFGYTADCPFHVRCMTEISVTEVYLAATALLNKA